MKKTILLITLLLLQHSFGQIIWTKAIGGSGDDYRSDLIKTLDGGYLTTCVSDSQNGDMTYVNFNNSVTENFDISVVKMNANGVLQWQKFYGTSSNYDSSSSIINTSDGGYLLSFHSNSNFGDVDGNYGGYDINVLKLNTVGDILWTKHYGGSGNDYNSYLLENNDGSIALFGITDSTNHDVINSSPSSETLSLYLHLSSTGVVLHSKTFGTAQYNQIFSKPLSINNSIYFLNTENSYSTNFNPILDEVHICKIDLLGTIQNQFIVNNLTASIYYLDEILVKNNNGTIELFGVNDSNNTIVKRQLASNLEPINPNVYYSSNNDKSIIACTYNATGDLLVGLKDWYNPLGYGEDDYRLNIYNASGSFIHSKNFGGSNYDDLSDLILDGDHVVLFGDTYSTNQDVIGFHPGIDSNGYELADQFIVKYNINGILNNTDFKSDYFTVMPNPVKDILTIKGLANEKIVAIMIYDLLGREAIAKTEIINNQINMSELTNGVYIIKIITDTNKIQEFKVIKE